MWYGRMGQLQLTPLNTAKSSVVVQSLGTLSSLLIPFMYSSQSELNVISVFSLRRKQKTWTSLQKKKIIGKKRRITRRITKRRRRRWTTKSWDRTREPIGGRKCKNTHWPIAAPYPRPIFDLPFLYSQTESNLPQDNGIVSVWKLIIFPTIWARELNFYPGNGPNEFW